MSAVVRIIPSGKNAPGQLTEDELRLLGLLRKKHTVLFLVTLSGLSWLAASLGNLLQQEVLGWVVTGLAFMAFLSLCWYGRIVGRPHFIATAIVLGLGLLFVLPYHVLQPWVAQVGGTLLFVLAWILVVRSQPLPDDQPVFFARSLLVSCLYIVIALLAWVGLTFMMSSIYPVRDQVVDQLVRQAGSKLESETEVYILRSQVNPSGRYYTLSGAAGTEVFSANGTELRTPGGPLVCTPPYPALPSSTQFTQWSCRILDNSWMFFHDLEQSISWVR